MKYLIYTDVHWCRKESLVNTQGDKYTSRIENLMRSVNWAEDQAIKNKCDAVICLGDFFNAPDLKSEELTSILEIKWAPLPHHFLIGNHDAYSKDLVFNSVNVLYNLGFDIIKEVTYNENESLLYIPYLQDDIRKTIAEYRSQYNIPENKKLIVLSHNDVKGIQYGPVISKAGIELEDIENNCSLFLNGHIHNGSRICKNGFNLGNLTGKNFTEDAFKYVHPAFILEVDDVTKDITLDTLINPYAFNFYQVNILKNTDIDKVIDSLKDNAVVSFKCIKSKSAELREKVEHCQKIKNSRITITLDPQLQEIDESEKIDLNNEDYLQQFKSFTLTELGYSPELEEELNRIILQ